MGSSRVIGLDIGTTEVRAVELEPGGGRGAKGTPVLHRHGRAPLPPGAVRDGEVVDHSTVSAALRHLWQQCRFSTKDVVIGVGSQRVVVRELDLPWMPLPQLKASLPFQVQEMLPVSVDEMLLDFFPTGDVQRPEGRAVRGLLVAAPRETVSANLLAIEGAGLRPTVVDLNGFALLRALSQGELSERIAAFVEIGARTTTVVVAHGATPRLVRVLPVGGQNITDAVAAALSVSQPDAEQIKREIGVTGSTGAAPEAVMAVTRSLVESIRNTFVYYSGNNPGQAIELVVLSGGCAHLPGFGQYLSSASRLPAVLGDALAGVRVAKGALAEDLRGRESLIAISTGLAYGAAA